LGTAARRSGIGSEETLRRAMRRGAVTGRGSPVPGSAGGTRRPGC
jgi:hypothetical protein